MRADEAASLVVDGRTISRLTGADTVEVRRADPTFKLVEVPGHGYYRTLLGDPRFARHEGSSFFSLANRHWRLLGLDTAYVEQSVYLPASRGLTLTDTRDRARIGVTWDRDGSHGFFGLTYLGREFTTQSEPQVVGSIRLALRF